MKATLKSLILTILALGVMLSSCDTPAKRLQQARALYEEGTELRQQRLSEEATERFLQALTLMQGCESTTENLRLEGQLKDNLGAMYNKHGLFDDALKMHCEAIACFRQIDDSTAVMTTMRNCGRVAKSLEQFAQAKRYYDTAFSIATLLNDKAMQSDIYLEMGRDYYLPVGNYPEAMTCVRHALEGELDDNNTDIANMTMGVLYYYTDNYAEAKPYLEAALRSERAGLKMSVYQTLYAIAYNEGHLEQAMEYQDLFTQNMMQADKEHASDNLQRLKAEYELKAQKSEMESLLRNRSLKLWLIIAAAVIALLVIVLIVRKKVSDHKLAVEQFRSQVERDQNRIHELVSDMENLIRTNDDLRRDRQTLSQKDLLMTSKDDEQDHGAQQGLHHGASPWRPGDRRHDELRPQRRRLGRLHQSHRLGLRRLFAAPFGTLSQTRQVGCAHLLPLQERLLQPGDFHPLGHPDRVVLPPQDPHQADEDEPHGRYKDL